MMENSVEKQSNRLDFKFTGSAGEYFGIWFVNGLLTSITFGIYGPWAKVKRFRYFYSHTSLADSPFQFLANPVSMLVSRLIAIGLFVLFIISDQFTEVFYAAMVTYIALLLLYFIGAPILLILMASFRLRNSAWRNVRFGFNKDYWWAYRVYLAPVAVLGVLIIAIAAPIYVADAEHKAYLQSQPAEPVESSSSDTAVEDEVIEESDDETVTVSDFVQAGHFIPAAVILVLFIVLIPYFDFIHMRFLSMNARFGKAKFTLTSAAKDFYAVYLVSFGFMGILAAAWFCYFYFDLEGALYTTLVMLLTVLILSLIKAYFKAQRYNLIFNNLTLGEGHKISAQAMTLSVFWLIFTNTLAIILTFGFMRPWADVRIARYFLGITQFNAAGSMDDFIAATEKDESAFAEEVADVFDLELG